MRHARLQAEYQHHGRNEQRKTTSSWAEIHSLPNCHADQDGDASGGQPRADALEKCRIQGRRAGSAGRTEAYDKSVCRQRNDQQRDQNHLNGSTGLRVTEPGPQQRPSDGGEHAGKRGS